MSDHAPESASVPLSLPDAPNLDWLRKQAKRRLTEIRQSDPTARLADAQFDLAKRFGFPSWRALKAHVDSLTVDGQLVAAARTGDTTLLVALLDAHPARLEARSAPYEFTLLHTAAQAGQLAVIELLLQRGLDVNSREQGDNTYAMHWAAAAGRLDIVRTLTDAGGDVVGHGDDHQLEVIGWATCWDGCDDAAHRAVVDHLVGRGARHHIFSAIALSLAEEVRRIVAADPSALTTPMSRNENFQRPLHFAVRKNLADMVKLLLELGADPAATDGSGDSPMSYATDPEVDRSVIEALAAATGTSLFTALALGDHAAASLLLGANLQRASASGDGSGALPMMARRGDRRAVQWLLDNGVDPSSRWRQWEADVTALHFAAGQGDAEMVRLLIAAGADTSVRDTRFDATALGWAEHFGKEEVVRLLQSLPPTTP